MKKIWNSIKGNWKFILAIVIVLCISRAQAFGYYYVVGESMMPTLTDGQNLFGSTIANYKRGDIVIIKLEETTLVKRIIGLPGETIESKNGNIYINNVLLEEDYIEESRNQVSSQNEWKVELDDNEYFCMGDNRDHSADSRYFGAFTKEQLIQKIYLY